MSTGLGEHWTGPLRRWLFPEALPAAPKSAVAKVLSWLAYLAGAALVTGAALARQDGAPAWRTMWAEDGKVFYSQALSLGLARTLVTPHAGYVQLFPRLVAAGATLFPARQASTVIALAGASSLGVLSCLVFHMAKGHVPSVHLRVLLCAAMVLLPVAGGELLDNAVNVPWWLFFACFWALLWRPRTRAGAVVALVVCALAAASEPLTALLAPLAGLRALALQRRAMPSGHSQGHLPLSAGGGEQGGTHRSSDKASRHAATVGLAAGLAFQACVVLVNGSGGGAATAFTAPRASAVARALAERVGLGLFAGVKGTNWLAAHHPSTATVLGFVVMVLVASAGIACRATQARAFAIVAAVGATACFVLEAWVRGIAPVLATDHVQTAGRYQAVPLLLEVSSLLVSAQGWSVTWRRRLSSSAAHRGPASSIGGRQWPSSISGQRRPSSISEQRRPSWIRGQRRPSSQERRPPAYRKGHQSEVLAAALCAALLAPTWAVDFHDPNARSKGPLWPTGALRAEAMCKALKVPAVFVPVDPPGWAAKLPCSALTSTHAHLH